MKRTLVILALLATSLPAAAGAGTGADVYSVTTGRPAAPLVVQPVTSRSGRVGVVLEPIYRIEVVARTIQAVNFKPRSGETDLAFRGTALLPAASGEAEVRSKQGRSSIESRFAALPPPSLLGPEYLTYVLWAITPEGRPRALGELVPGRDLKLEHTTELQAFGMIVTAEPHFAVTRPSEQVVLEAVVRPDAHGTVEEVEARYELFTRAAYDGLEPSTARGITDPREPLELREARNAVRIARLLDADRYAAETFGKATQLLDEAVELRHRKGSRSRTAAMAAREAAQMAEDARLVAEKRIDEEQRTAERERAAAERQAAEAGRAAAEADAARAEAARALAERDRVEAEAKAAQAERDREAAERDRAELRERLRVQISKFLETRETARGLIVSLSDVLFDTDQASLKPGAREKLAKVAGILVAYPGLVLTVEGHTDSRGTEEHNQDLSERRAGSVRDYLVAQGVPAGTVTSHGLGESSPVASNDTAEGRQLNRRVEIVVQGELVGTAVGKLEVPGR